MSRDADAANIGLSVEAAKKYFSANSGALYEIKKTKLLKKAFETPGLHYSERAGALEDAATKADDAFAGMYEKLIKEKVAPEAAKQRASAYATAVHNALVSDVDFEYPTALNTLAAKISYAKGEAANSGFAVDAGTGAKPRARRARARKPKA